MRAKLSGGGKRGARASLRNVKIGIFLQGNALEQNVKRMTFSGGLVRAGEGGSHYDIYSNLFLWLFKKG